MDNQTGENGTGNIIRFLRPIHINIGIVMCVIIFIYVLFHVFSYITEKKVTIYEVKAGKIVSDHVYRAMAIRKESVVASEDTGYLYYFIPNKSRAGVKTDIYSVDQTGDVIKVLTDDEADIDITSSADYRGTEGLLASFVNDYSSSSFQKTYAFKDALAETLKSVYNDAVMKKHRDEIEKSESADTYHKFKPEKPGFVVYTIDGLEDTTVKNFKPEMFEGSNSDAVNLKSREEVAKGDPAYKLITSDDWTLLIEADDDLIEDVRDLGSVKIGFTEDNTTTWASCSVKEKDDMKFFRLDLDDSMERYADERFIDVELKINEESGLKIPNSSIVKKEFFTIPKDYFYTDGNTNEEGVSVTGKNGEKEFIAPTIYYEDKKCYYVDSQDLSKGDVISLTNSLDTYVVGDDVKELSGVYNVNKGYAVFKQIEPIYESDDYTIIRSGTSYGVSMYDHIVLQGGLVKENDIIH